mmetsp:Transcript_5874/g.18522  ORF Transcript_5874/g.18522 Transcript_5874/m.18522 type:complete len:175 (-) Transcript_5874:378-902(-)
MLLFFPFFKWPLADGGRAPSGGRGDAGAAFADGMTKEELRRTKVADGGKSSSGTSFGWEVDAPVLLTLGDPAKLPFRPNAGDCCSELFDERRRIGVGGSSFFALFGVGGFFGPNEPTRPRGAFGVGGLPSKMDDFRVSVEGSFVHAELGDAFSASSRLTEFGSSSGAPSSDGTM